MLNDDDVIKITMIVLVVFIMWICYMLYKTLIVYGKCPKCTGDTFRKTKHDFEHHTITEHIYCTTCNHGKYHTRKLHDFSDSD